MQLKKLFAGVAAAATLLGGMALGAGTAVAADADPAKTITFTASTEAQLKGVSVDAYKLADYVTDASGALTAVKSAADGVSNDDVIEQLGNSGVTVPDGTADALAWAVANNQFTDQVSRKFATNLYKNYALPNSPTQTLTLPTPTEANGVWSSSVTLDTAGLYLFTSGVLEGVSGTSAIIVGTPVTGLEQYTGTVAFKNSVLTLVSDRDDDGDDANDVNPDTTTNGTIGVGETVNYTLTGVVGNTSGTTDYALTFVVFFSDGQSSQGTSVGNIEPTVKLVASDGTETPLTSHDYVISGPSRDSTGTIRDGWTFSLTVNNLTGKDGTKVVVSYPRVLRYNPTDGKVVTKAGITQGQTGLSRPGNGMPIKEGDYSDYLTNTLTTSGFAFTKVDADHNGLAGAEFNVYKTDANGAKAGDALAFDAGVRSLKTGAATLTTPANGELALSGLSAGKYYVEETKVPDGFDKTKAAKFFVTVAKDGKLTFENAGGDVNMVQKDNTILNVKEGAAGITQLPLTGGAGIALFTVVAAALLGAGAFGVVRMRRQSVAGRSVRA